MSSSSTYPILWQPTPANWLSTPYTILGCLGIIGFDVFWFYFVQCVIHISPINKYRIILLQIINIKFGKREDGGWWDDEIVDGENIYISPSYHVWNRFFCLILWLFVIPSPTYLPLKQFWKKMRWWMVDKMRW